jgi:hypothetical protein
MFVLIDTIFFMEKIEILTSIPKALEFDNTKNLCHHVKHTLFYMWLKYEVLWTNIVIVIDSFLIKVDN